MTLLEQWRNHPTRRRELAELMREPAFVDALAIAKERLFQVQFPPTGSATFSLMEYHALYGAKKMGYEEALQNLLGLAELSVYKMPDRKPWDAGAREIEKLTHAETPPQPTT